MHASTRVETLYTSTKIRIANLLLRPLKVYVCSSLYTYCPYWRLFQSRHNDLIRMFSNILSIIGFVNNLVARDLSMPPTLDYDEKMQLDNDLRENTFTEEDFVPDYY